MGNKQFIARTGHKAKHQNEQKHNQPTNRKPLHRGEQAGDKQRRNKTRPLGQEEYVKTKRALKRARTKAEWENEGDTS